MVSCDGEMDGHRVVISGIAGRFPSSDNVAELQYNLLNGIDCTTTDHDRWEDYESENVPQRLGVYNNGSKFDRVFFGVHAKLTTTMDPASRMMLEHSFEAIMDAGINPRTLKGQNVAVYTATSLSESEKSLFTNKKQPGGFGIMGFSKAMLPNRISFFLGLVGSSINIDSGETGAGTALERAFDSVRSGRSNAAIVGGCGQCLHPHLSYQIRKLGLLSEDGYTRCFDNEADGHTRGEALTVFYLQRAQDAKRIYMEVIGSKTVHVDSYDVKSVLYPTKESQIEIMKAVLKESKLTPDDISYIEASGMAVRDADADELNAIDAVYGKRKKPLPIGSVRSIVGDNVAANTSVSIVKMIIASETGLIAPNLNYNTPNSKAPGLTDGRLKVLTDLTPWDGQYCAVNTTSTNATVSNTILRAPNIEKKNGIPNDDLPRLIVVSGRTEDAVETLLSYMEGRAVDAELLQLFYDIFQTEIDGHLYRGYTIVPSRGLLQIESKKREIFFQSGEKKEIWWVFSGMGSQWVGMGEALLKLPIFEAAIRKCDAVLKPQGYDVYKIITGKDPDMFDHIINSFIGIAAIQIGLVDVLRAVGLEPDYIIGHSVGELGCAYADGCFSAEQMIMAALSRGLASKEANLPKGSMAAVGLGHSDIKPLCPPDIDVACHNGPGSSTISGPAESMKKFVAKLTADGIFAREVPCSNIAYHSRYIAAAGPKLLERLQKVIPKPIPRSPRWVSTSAPRSEWNTVKARLSSAEYHTNNLLSPVLFDETSRMIPPNAICIEIAPHGLLQAILKKSLPESCINVALTRRGHPDNLEVLLTSLGKIYNAGLQIQIANLYPKIKYPVGKSTPSISSLVKWDHSSDWHLSYYTAVNKSSEGERVFEINLNEEESQFLQGNVIDGKFVLPLSMCLLHAWEILKSSDNEEIKDIVFEEIKVHKPLIEVPDNNIIKLTVMVPKGTKKFEVICADKLVLNGVLKATKSPNEDRLNVSQSKHFEEKSLELSQEDFYTELEMRGYQYSEDFKGIHKSSTDGTRALIKWNDNYVTFIDSALQLFTFGNDLREVEMPLLIRKIIIDQKLQETASKNSDVIKAYRDTNLNYLYAGGLEIQGPIFTRIPKNLDQNKLTNDVLSVVPNVEKSNLPLTASLRVVLQLIIENIFSDKIKTIELIQNDNLLNVSTLKQLLYDIPEAVLFKIETISYKTASFNKILTVITDDLKNYNLKEIAQKLEANKFLLSIVKSNQEDSSTKAAESAGLKVILIKKHANETILLLRKKQLLVNVQTIHASENIKEIINKIKNTNVSLENGRVIVIIKSANIKSVVACIDQIQDVISLDKIRIFNIQSSQVSDNSVIEKLCSKQSELDLLINVLTPNNDWATIRRTRAVINPKLSKYWVANQKYINDPYNITWTEGPIVEKTENLAKVEYAALNVQDVHIANRTFYSNVSEIVGKERLVQKTIGLEFSGTDSKGNKIMGLTNGNSMSNYVNTDPMWTWPIPKSWSLEDAATVPLSYMLAYAALFTKAEVQSGDKVLLINSCDGLGLAILNLAVQKKCDVFVVHETEAEKKLILSIVPSLPNNRLFKLSKDSSPDDILLETKGVGVDVVICNYCEIKKVEVFLSVTKRAARVISVNDLTDNQIHEKIGMEIFLKEVNFFSVVPKKVLSYSSEKKKNLANMLKEGITSGTVKPLPRIIYARESVNEAFTACAMQRQIGKILVKVQPDGSNKNEALAIPRFYCSKTKSYVILEGLSNFGLELIDWLITHGARHFIITSNQKGASGYQNLRMKLWQSYGVQIILHKEFNSTNQNIKTLLQEASTLGPVDAIFDLQRLSAILEKTNISVDTLNSTTKIVDEVSRSLCPELRSFVICTATVNVGSLVLRKKIVPFENINLQNELVEKIIKQRKADGLEGIFIKWGLIDSTKESNVVLPPASKYVQKLDEILGTEESIVEVSYTNSPPVQADEDLDDDASLTPAKKEVKQFSKILEQQTASCIDGITFSKI